MDIFKKCYSYSLANELRAKGIYPYFHALETRQDTEVIMEGKRRIMLGSNNYLGLTSCPEVVEAGIRALEEYGTGCSGSRLLIGTLIGILIIGIIANGLNLLGVAQGPQKMVKGMIIVVAVIIDVIRRKASQASK